MDTNFFGYLLGGITNLTQPVLDVLPLHSNFGIADLVTAIFGDAATLIIFVAGSFFDLEIFAFVLATILTWEGIRRVLAVYRWVTTLISDLPIL